MIPPSTGEIVQLAVMPAIAHHLTLESPAAATPAPIMPPMSECVVETGARE